ncbi:adenosylcobinamide-GDP ribazoletransferase [Calidifontibacter terrae]
MSSLVTGLRLSLGTLTVIPSGDIGDFNRDAARWSMLLAPLAALPLGVAAGLLAVAGWHSGLPGAAVGLLIVGALAVLTRALHLDGLADTVDGLGGGWTRERALEIMHTGDIGPMGVVALLIGVGLQAICIGAIDVHPFLVCVSVVASRCVLGVACARGIHSARPEGMGALVAGTVPRWAAALVAAIGTALLTMTCWWVGLPPLQGLLAVLAAALSVGLLLRRCVRRLGGVTGDVLGACVELAFTAQLLVLAAVAR